MPIYYNVAGYKIASYIGCPQTVRFSNHFLEEIRVLSELR